MLESRRFTEEEAKKTDRNREEEKAFRRALSKLLMKQDDRQKRVGMD